MVKHIVLFKLKNTTTDEEKSRVMNSFKEAIEALPDKIPVIRKIEVGLNITPSEFYDIALYSEFDSREDLDLYANHPEHIAAGKILAQSKESRACVDYEF